MTARVIVVQANATPRASTAGPYHLANTDYSRGQWYLHVYQDRADVTAVFHTEYHAPSLNPSAWLLVAACPPNLQGQKLLYCRYSAKTEGGYVQNTYEQENAGEMRHYMLVSLPGNQSIYPDGYSSDAVYSVRLFARHLLPKVASDMPIADLPSSERDEFLLPTAHIDWRTGALADWIRSRSLYKSPDENPVAFAWRVATALHDDFHYGNIGCPDADTVCRQRTGDCGGLSSVIVGVLRANGIPARLDVGFNVKAPGSAVPDYHARCEFFSKDAGGWIPIDGSGLTAQGPQWKYQFGQDFGNHLSVMTDTDMQVDAGQFGEQSVILLQIPLQWASGSGNYNGAHGDYTVAYSQTN